MKRLFLVILSFFILCSCSSIESPRPIEQSQTIAVFVNKTPLNIAANSQTPVNVQTNEKPVIKIKGGGELCENNLLKKIAVEKAEGSQIIKLKAFNPDDETLSSELKKWFQEIHSEMLVPFELQLKEKKVLILRANIAGATGIAANFENWFIQSDTYSLNFRSLSENPELIFFDKTGLLNYYSIDYGEAFLKNRDWDNLSLNLLQYKINLDGKSELIGEERNVKCK